MAAPRPAPLRPPRAAQDPDAVPKTSLGLEEHLSRALQDKLRFQKVPTWDSASLLPSRRLLLKRREVVEVERALQAQREDFQQQMDRLARRRQQLGQREEQLRDDTIKFNAFLKAMSARRQRAQQRAGEERARAAQHRAEALRLQQELERLQGHREQLGQRLRSLRVFSDFLQDVRAATGRFQDVPSMLAHFGALMEAQAVLLQQVEAGRVALAQGRAQLQQRCEEADGELTSGNEEVLQLRARLEAARHDVLKGESRWAQLEGAAAQKTLLLGQIRMAVLSLFQLATTRLEVPKDVALGDTEAQLDVVSVAQQPRGWKGCGCPCDTEAPVSPAAALHAGPGCHLCRAGAASSCACHHCHKLTASQGCRCASQPRIDGLRTQ
ncbi:cilia- and flagella-associated protein 73 isoform X1 [Tympanuchus pallidicinctus]|uniref:cilia- and flagella-associated protein 73 isoform X1 n=1 Tax=Tympanuchus pallidicinctus TaxID=109042 RepID=UPI0022872A29|nr:cilia- and flagella-associated protein 73 isoform X1 [Tympanuchus pallidicinctus]